MGADHQQNSHRAQAGEGFHPVRRRGGGVRWIVMPAARGVHDVAAPSGAAGMNLDRRAGEHLARIAKYS